VVSVSSLIFSFSADRTDPSVSLRVVDITQIADRVMASGLGLGHTADARSPQPDNPPAVHSRSISPTGARPTFRRMMSHPDADSRRPSSSTVGFQARLEKRRATMAQVANGVPRPIATLLPPKDIHIIFVNLEAIAGLAEAFAGVLDGAKGSETGDGRDDRIGEVFTEMVRLLGLSPLRAASLTIYLSSSHGFKTPTRPTAPSTTAPSSVYKSSRMGSRAIMPTAKRSLMDVLRRGTWRVYSSSQCSDVSSEFSYMILLI
jgi:hypothetical protein